MNRNIQLLAGVVITLFVTVGPSGADDSLVGHWKLTSDARDSSGANRHAVNHGVKFEGDGGAVFDGIDAWLEVPPSDSISLGKDPFTITVSIHTEEQLDDVLGDVLTCFDPAKRTGFTISLMNYSGVTNAQSNWRNVLFGIDAGHVDAEWTDCGRPGTNMMVKALTVFDGDLYAAVWEPAEGGVGHVYRYAGGTEWIDCGSPDICNAICAMAVYEGKLYVGSELYSGGGSALPLSPNENHGGSVFRYDGGTEWTDCGKIADVRSVSGLTVFKGKLYAGTGTTRLADTSLTRGMYRYDGDGVWTDCGFPGQRIVHLSVYNGELYGLSYDNGGFFRYEGGTDWTSLGPVPETTQNYGTAIYEGRLLSATWPTGSVYRYEGPQEWTHFGRLGEEKEVMGMAVYNGQLYAGTLPLAHVFRYEGDNRWVSTGAVDTTPDVTYRRAWSMAVFDGKLFCGTLPSGHVLSLEAGRSATYDRALSAGWHHLAAVRTENRLKLFIDGELVSESSEFDPDQYDLTTDQPLKIGFGQHDYFNGRMKDLRIYNRALSKDELR
ncbi:MAG: LamG domain-containing protein [Planctomycetota bacterium]|nr:LamG domain-containing protein [Planctomycetota bacterium]MDA1214472.1 LamG domain-containing protein [Planctomycetota bacterium]